MTNDILYSKLLEKMREQIPERGRLVQTLAKLLNLEKEAVYRRLRNEVSFSFSEISQIVIAMGISLNKIVAELNPSVREFNLRLIEFLNPDKSDLVMLERFTENSHLLAKDPNSECGSIANMIPVTLSAPYNHIYKFYFYKWGCQFGQISLKQKFADIEVNKELIRINQEYAKNLKKAPSTIYIFDKNFIYNLVKDISHFYNMKILTKNEVACLQQELFLFIQDMERYARNGQFDEGGKLDVYLSNVSFDTNYNFQYTQDYKLTTIRAFSFSDAYALDEKIYKNALNWIQFLKKKSTAISGTGEIERINFFSTQQEIIKTLS